MKNKRLLLFIAIAMGLLGARQVICTPCAAEARLLETQLAQVASEPGPAPLSVR